MGESLSIAVAMNARGAMELVVATIGLSLGILNQEMYSIVVMVAVTTSFMAPLLLRLTMRLVRVTDEEAARMAADEAKGVFDPEKIRVLVPTAGGPNALVASGIGMRLARRSAHPLTLLYVERVSGWTSRIFGTDTGKNLAQHLDKVRAMASVAGVPSPEVRKQTSRDVVRAIGNESSKGYDVMLVGASESRRGVRGEKLEKLVAEAPCHVAIVKHRGGSNGAFGRRLLVPIDGSFFSRVAVEFAIRYAEGVGEGSEVTMAVVTESGGSSIRPESPNLRAKPITGRSMTAVAPGRANSVMLMMDSLAQDGGLEKLSPVFKATKIKTRVIVRQPTEAGPDRLPILSEANSGRYDMVVLGAEHRAIHYRLFFGYDNERLVEESQITVVLVVPKVRAA
jgi:nucleotide-binding universal stress UspA family protein